MVPATVKVDDIIKTGVDIPPHATKSNTHTPCAVQNVNKSPGATEYNSNDNLAIEIANSVHSAPDNDSNPPGLTENNNAIRAAEDYKVLTGVEINDDISSEKEINKNKHQCATKDKDDVTCATKSSSNATFATENNDIRENDIIREKDSTGQMEEDITKKLSNNADQFTFGKKTLVLAVSEIFLISAFGYFAFFSR